MKFNVTIDRDKDGVWVVECPSIPGCVSQGQTKEEALENIKDAVAQTAFTRRCKTILGHIASWQ